MSNTPNTQPETPAITHVRQHLLNTLAALCDKTSPMEPDRARAVAQVASVAVDTARVEIEYLKLTGQDHSTFLQPEAPPATLPNGITGITRHRLAG